MRARAYGMLATFALFAAPSVVACDRSTATARPDENARTLTLPSIEPTLPEGPGKSEVVGSCRTCHSPAYLLNQPRFSRKTWSAEVDKMKNVYGAPIPPEAMAPIVDYLVAIRGDGS